MLHQGKWEGTGSASCKGNKAYPFLLVQPQSLFTYILLSTPMVFIQKSHAFTSLETITNKIFLAKEVLWIRCAIFSVLETSAFVPMHQGWMFEEHVESAREGIELDTKQRCPGNSRSSAADLVRTIFGIMVLTPTLSPWVSLACWVLYVIGQDGIRGSVCAPNLPWHSCLGIPSEAGFIFEHWCWWQGWVMVLFSFRVLESTIWVVA